MASYFESDGTWNVNDRARTGLKTEIVNGLRIGGSEGTAKGKITDLNGHKFEFDSNAAFTVTNESYDFTLGDKRYMGTNLAISLERGRVVVSRPGIATASPEEIKAWPFIVLVKTKTVITGTRGTVFDVNISSGTQVIISDGYVFIGTLYTDGSLKSWAEYPEGTNQYFPPQVPDSPIGDSED